MTWGEKERLSNLVMKILMLRDMGPFCLTNVPHETAQVSITSRPYEHIPPHGIEMRTSAYFRKAGIEP